MKVAAPCITLLLFTSAAAVENCATLEACLAKYPAAASSDPGVGPKQDELAKAVQKYGARAVPGLIKLLESDSRNARELAGYTLRDIDGLEPEHLPALMKARRNGDGWIPPAIARVGTPEAVAFLVEDLRNDPEIHTQVTVALRRLGAKAAPGLASLLKCAEPCDGRVPQAAAFVLGEMKEDALVVVPLLLQTARDDQIAHNGRQQAVFAIGLIGEAASPYIPQLLELKKAVPSLEPETDHALASIGAAEAVPGLLANLPVDPEFVMSRISSLGKNGYSAGPTVTRYLEDRRWDVRVAAANTLGSIAYGPAETALAEALTDEDDWKLVYAAAISLAELKAKNSLSALKQVRDTHWYPPVRDIAATAVGHIESGSPLPEFESIGAVEGSPKSCSSVKERILSEPKLQKLYAQQHKREVKRLTYGSTVRSYGPPEGAEPDEHGIIEVNQDNMVEHVEEIKQIPDVALKVPDGWLVGADRGEWGGELVHIPAQGPGNVLYEENIEDIYLLDSQLVATSGLAHMMMNNGMLLRIDRNDTGRYMATPWKRLPAAPATSSLLEGNRVLINTYSGGSVIVDANGNLRMAECAAN